MLLYCLAVSYIKLNFKLKFDPKKCTFKNLEEIWKKRVATLSLRNISKFLDKLFLTPCSSCNTSLKYTAEGLVF